MDSDGVWGDRKEEPITYSSDLSISVVQCYSQFRYLFCSKDHNGNNLLDLYVLDIVSKSAD